MLKLKSLFLTAFLFTALAASAQLSFGVKAGLNMSTITDVDDSKMKIGYKIGPTVEYALDENMAIQSALLLSSKGVKRDVLDYTRNANYLELPISFAYKYPIAYDTKIYANAGPYFAYGIFGKTKTKTEVAGVERETKYDTFDDDRMKNFDMGLTFGVGLEITQFNFGLNYDLGLTKISDEILYKDSKNGNFWISLGYKF